MNKGVSVVVLNYGWQPFVSLCLDSLANQDCRVPVEVIVVDNGSSLDDWSRMKADLEQKHAGVKCIRLARNGGFAVGMNAGLSAASHDLMVALNSDVLVGNRAFDLLIEHAQDPCEPCFYAFPVYDWDYPLRRDSTSRRLQADAVVLTCHVGVLPVAWYTVRDGVHVGPPGPAVAFNRACWERINGEYGFFYDPRFFMYGEDVDLFLRAARAGVRLVRLPGEVECGQVLWHAGGASSEDRTSKTAGRDPVMMGHISRAWWGNAARHSGWVEAPIIIGIQVMVQILLLLACATRHGLRGVGQMLRVALDNRDGWLKWRARPFKPILLPRIAMVGRHVLRWQRVR